MSNDLKPCPFCGGEAEGPLGSIDDDKDMYHCSNMKCPLEAVWMPYWEWNRRHGEDQARAEGVAEGRREFAEELKALRELRDAVLIHLQECYGCKRDQSRGHYGFCYECEQRVGHYGLCYDCEQTHDPQAQPGDMALEDRPPPCVDPQECTGDSAWEVGGR